MQNKLRTEKKEQSVAMSRGETELSTNPFAIQRDDSDPIELLQPIRPELLRTEYVRPRAMAASGPGTEYWLP
jgi:hypothetical protein